MKTPLRSGHFERWLVLWTTTSTSSSPARAPTVAKQHATRVARAFYGRIETMSAAPPLGGGFAITQHGPR